MTAIKRDHCRGCRWVEPTGRGTRAGVEVDIGTCHGDTPSLTAESAGTFVPVALDIDWCRHFEPPPIDIDWRNFEPPTTTERKPR